MASTYGWLSGAPSIAVVTRGPGAASAVNGAAQATLDRHPLLLVSDTVPSASRSRVPHQRIDQQAMLAPVTKASMVLGAQTTTDELAKAIDFAMAVPAGCVHLDYDTTADAEPQPAPVDDWVSSELDAANSLSAANALMAEAERPVIIVGVGATPDAASVRAAVERFGAPALTTYQGIGIVDSECELNAGLFTNGASERALLDQADLIVLVGVDFVEPIPAPWTYAVPVVSIGPRPVSDDYLPIAVELIGDVGALTTNLLVGPHTWDRSAGAAHCHAVRSQLAEADPPDVFGPVDLVRSCIEAAPSDATVTVDAGAHFLAIMPFWPARDPQRVLISNGLATMGYAVPAAIGAALARPAEPIVALTGDGGIGMCLAELETIVRLDLPITVVVFNDATLSLIKIKQRDDHGGPSAVGYVPTDFAAVARAMGMSAIVATTSAEVVAALGASGADPLLIDARIDPQAYPELIRITRG